MLAETKRAQFIARLTQWRNKHATVAIYFQPEGEIERFREIISTDALAGIDLLEGTLSRGFCFPAANLVILSANELLGRFPIHGRRRLRRGERRNRAQIDFSELNEDDLVVHLEHGIGRYEGMKSIPRARSGGVSPPDVPAASPPRGGGAAGTTGGEDAAATATEQVLVIAFADDARL